MCLNRRNKPIVILPIAMMFLIIGILWPKLIHSSSHLVYSGDDFMRGAVLGLSIGMLLMTVITMYRQRRRGENREATKTSHDPQL